VGRRPHDWKRSRILLRKRISRIQELSRLRRGEGIRIRKEILWSPQIRKVLRVQTIQKKVLFR
jgi:hypothetical protein